MTEKVILGVDLGTTSVKAVAFRHTGEAVAQCQAFYAHRHPQPGWAEQDPRELAAGVWEAVRCAAQRAAALGAAVEALSFSAMMHGVFAVSSDGAPLTPMMTWADTRSASQMEHIRSRLGMPLYRRTGTPLHPMSPIAKLAWMRDERADVYRDAARFVSIKEWIIWLLTGEWLVDYSTASATGLFNIHSLTWDEEALEHLGLDSSRLSRPVSTTTVLTVTDNILRQSLNLPDGVLVVIGATDGVLANVGTGVIHPHEMALTMGTSGAVRMTVESPWTDGSGRTFCYALTEDHWVIGGATNSGGLILQWLSEHLGSPPSGPLPADGNTEGDQTEAMTRLFETAAQAPAGSDGLLFLPYLAGERAPIWDERARGVLFGLGLHHTRAHMIRAALEGMAYALYSVYEVLTAQGSQVRTVKASGGFARSPLWRGLMCDLFGMELHAPAIEEASCFGAAVLALHALGYLERLADAGRLVRIASVQSPQTGNTETYRSYYPLFRRLYDQTKDSYRELGILMARSNSSVGRHDR